MACAEDSLSPAAGHEREAHRQPGSAGRLALFVGRPLHTHDGLVVRPEAVEGAREVSPVPDLHTAIGSTCIDGEANCSSNEATAVR